ncbi:MAG: hypothetical protein OEY18_08585 [Candidatus Aminicenantes bacterium]|nr:hypothetical protein [Candidatus Aminicenantes bacterium]MDH5384748.1 hypothetical protein [Candidatus Aminicenantes bacterium]
MNQKNYENYLINWRNSLWVSMREKESNCWKFLSFYMPAIAAIAAFGIDKLSLIVVVVAILSLTAWGILVSIDANFWFNRNLKLITNIEKYIAPYVYDQRLLPKQYGDPHFSYFLTYRTIFRVLNILFLGVLLWYILGNPNVNLIELNKTWILIFLWVSGLCVWCFLEDRHRRFQYVNFISALEESDKSKADKEKQLIKDLDLTGPISHWAASSIQLTSIAIIFEFAFPKLKNSNTYILLMFWPFVSLLVTSLFSSISRRGSLLGRKIFKVMLSIIVILFTLVSWIWALVLII